MEVLRGRIYQRRANAAHQHGGVCAHRGARVVKHRRARTSCAWRHRKKWLYIKLIFEMHCNKWASKAEEEKRASVGRRTTRRAAVAEGPGKWRRMLAKQSEGVFSVIGA
jgi:hypothetical protein